jgi:hypothetical protein
VTPMPTRSPQIQRLVDAPFHMVSAFIEPSQWMLFCTAHVGSDRVRPLLTQQ